MLNGVDRRIRYVEGVVAQTHQAEPARFVVAGEKLEAAQAPVLQRIAFHVSDEIRVGDHCGAEHRHAPGHRQHPLVQGYGAPFDVTLGDTHLVLFAHDVSAAHFSTAGHTLEHQSPMGSTYDAYCWKTKTHK